MKAAAVLGIGHIKIMDRPIPPIGTHDVLLKVRYCGVCATDVMIYNGVYSRDRLPLVPGHEFVGNIAAIGSDIKLWKEGDFVAVDINIGCGCCRYCVQNKPLLCTDVHQTGIHEDGGFAEYVVVPAAKLVKLPGTPDPLHYAFVEPVSAVVRSLKKAGLQACKNVAVHGDDYMALLHVEISRLFGAMPVILYTDNNVIAHLAKELGADKVLPTDDLIPNSVRNEIGCDGFDYVVEVGGSIASYEKANQVLGPDGILVAFGLASSGERAGYEPFTTVLKEQSIRGSVAGAGIDVFDAVTIIENNRLKMNAYPITVIPLEEIAKGLRLTASDPHIIKVVVDLGLGR